MAEELGIPMLSDNPLHFARHPLVYLVEAADDICYQVMDVEDAYKLGILGIEETRELFMNFHLGSDVNLIDSINKTLDEVTDPHEQISYLRAGVIGKLASACFQVFESHHDEIMQGEFTGSLMKRVSAPIGQAMKKVQEVSVSRIYNHKTVVEIEIAGYKIIGTLMDEFCNAILKPTNPLSEKIIFLIPGQYRPSGESVYDRIQSIVDFISGMTDVYALDLYRKIKGISLPEII